MIHAFMQIANYRTWLKGRSDGKGPDLASLKLKTTARCGDPKMLADAMKAYPGAQDVRTTLLCERRAESRDLESGERRENKNSKLDRPKKDVFKNSQEYTWYIPEYAKIVKIDLFLWNVKALKLKWSH